MPLVELSPGELLDRQTILELKASRVPRPKLAPVHAALAHVRAALAGVDCGRVEGSTEGLRVVNAQLWDAEDEVRAQLARGAAGAEAFARVAAQVPVLNDRRAGLKREIDAALGYAATQEVKHYDAPPPGPPAPQFH